MRISRKKNRQHKYENWSQEINLIIKNLTRTHIKEENKIEIKVYGRLIETQRMHINQHFDDCAQLKLHFQEQWDDIKTKQSMKCVQ